MKTVYIASDHAGFEMKKFLTDSLTREGFEVIDMGADEYNPSDDYPDLIAPLASKISELSKKEDESMGIILGGSGQGEAIVANRFSHVRAGVYNSHNLELAKLLREHNDANIISLGARFLSNDEALQAVHTFLQTSFTKDPRHERRIKEIDIECN